MAKGRTTRRSRADPPSAARGRQGKLAIVAALLAVLAVLVDIALVIGLAGWDAGITFVLHDPGRFFFHIFLLPLALWIFVAAYPTGLLSGAARGRRRVAIALAALGALLTVVGTVNDHHDGLCERFPAPVDIADASARQELIDAQVAGHAAIRAAVAKEDFKNASEEASNKYQVIVDGLRSGGCSFFALASPRQYWSFLVSLFGALFAVAVFWSALAHFVVGVRPSPKMLSAYLLVFALLLPWLLLGIYSEWYLHFGNLALDTYRTLYLVLGLALAMAFILFVLHLKQRVRLIAIAILTLIPSVLSVLGAVNPDWFSLAARVSLALDRTEISILYGILATTVGSLIWYLAQPETGAGQGADAAGGG